MRSFLTINDLNLSALSVGLMTNISPAEESQKLKLFSEAFELGINSFDTAPNYQDGYSDIFLGKLVRELGRENLFISSKIYFPNNYSNEKSLSNSHLVKTLDGSLKSMETDYLDCFLLHRFDNTTPIEETLGSLSKSYKAGKFKSWGISAFSLEEVLDYYYLSEKFDLPRPRFAQYAYNLFNRSIEKEFDAVFLKKSINVFAYYPLAQGVLTGKYLKETKSSRGNDEFFKKFMWDLTPDKIEKVKLLNEYCLEKQLDMIEVAYLWCLRNENVVSLITNFRNSKQLNHNINCLKSAFNSEIKTTLEGIFSNKPINQYTGQQYEISERTL